MIDKLLKMFRKSDDAADEALKTTLNNAYRKNQDGSVFLDKYGKPHFRILDGKGGCEWIQLGGTNPLTPYQEDTIKNHPEMTFYRWRLWRYNKETEYWENDDPGSVFYWKTMDDRSLDPKRNGERSHSDYTCSYPFD